jgi:signal transduction histidine kinase
VVVDGPLPRVRGDRGRLVKVFRALLENSLAHGGARPLTIRVYASDGGGAVTVTVADDGNGFDPDLRPRLFTLLPATANGGGAGRVPAGLAVCRRIVEGHGGTIWAEPAAGRGAVVRFTLPPAGG